jgi:hypothetical protein
MTREAVRERGGMLMNRWSAGLRVAMVAGLMAVGVSGCAIDPVSPSTPSALQSVATESFVGNLTTTGSRFYSFTVPTEGRVSLTLLSLTVSGTASDLRVTLSLGVPAGVACRATNSIQTAAGLSPQVTNVVQPGVYCVAISDPGTLTAAADFGINITRPR